MAKRVQLETRARMASLVNVVPKDQTETKVRKVSLARTVKRVHRDHRAHRAIPENLEPRGKRATKETKAKLVTAVPRVIRVTGEILDPKDLPVRKEIKVRLVM